MKNFISEDLWHSNKIMNLLQLQDIHILYILGLISNIDKICLTLTCKTLFTRYKDRLWFKWGDMCHRIDYNGIKLKSYQNSIVQNRPPLNHVYYIDSIQELMVLGFKSKRGPSSTYEDEGFDYRDWISSEGIAPPKPYTIIFGRQFNSKIPPNVIPKHIRHIEFGFLFNQPIDDPDILPPGLVSLTFYGHVSKCDQQLLPGILPQSLKVLRLTYYHNKHPFIKGVFPDGLELLQFYANEYVGGGILPSSLKCIQFGDYYHEINEGDIPDGVEHISYPTGLEQHLIYLPPRCKVVELSYNYSNIIGAPSTLTKVLNVENILLESNTLPSSVVCISTSPGRSPMDCSKLPRNLTELTMYWDSIINQDQLPESLTRITIERDCFHDIVSQQGITISQNHNIKHLVLGKCKREMCLANFSKLETLEIGEYDYPLDSMLSQSVIPPSLKKLIVKSGNISNESQTSITTKAQIQHYKGDYETYKRILSSINTHIKVLELIHESDYKSVILGDIITLDKLIVAKWELEIRRLSPTSILIFSNGTTDLWGMGVVNGIITFTLDDLQLPLSALLSMKYY